MPRRTAFLWMVLAVVGIAAAAGLTLAATQLSMARIGLEGEPLTAGRALAPPGDRRTHEGARPRRHAAPAPAAAPSPAPAPAPVPVPVPVPVPAPAPPPIVAPAPAPVAPLPPARSPPRPRDDSQQRNDGHGPRQRDD